MADLGEQLRHFQQIIVVFWLLVILYYMLCDFCPQFAVFHEKAHGNKVEKAVFVEAYLPKHKGAVKCLHLLIALIPVIPQVFWADLFWSLAFTIKRSILYFPAFQIRGLVPSRMSSHQVVRRRSYFLLRIFRHIRFCRRVSEKTQFPLFSSC